jgi:hypothetical protein
MPQGDLLVIRSFIGCITRHIIVHFSNADPTWGERVSTRTAQVEQIDVAIVVVPWFEAFIEEGLGAPPRLLMKASSMRGFKSSANTRALIQFSITNPIFCRSSKSQSLQTTIRTGRQSFCSIS